MILRPRSGVTHRPRRGGFRLLDREIPPGSDWNQFITRALSAAQVFVPLYSVGYLTNSWPGRELTCFKERVKVAGGRDPISRLVPVLWAPLAGVKERRRGCARPWTPLTDPDYADNGLCALLRLKPTTTCIRTWST